MRRLVATIMMAGYLLATFIVIPACLWQESSILKMDARQKPSGMTKSSFTYELLSISKKDVPLKQGVFLVATPELMDPNFYHTVILLVSYGKDGALGLIINRPTEITIQQAIPDIKEFKNAASIIYFGGPVNRNNLFALFTSDKKPDNAQNAIGNIYFSGSKDIILSLLKNGDEKERKRIYAGYAGWIPEQLEFEIRRGSWKIIEASEEMIFSDFPENIWPSIFKKREEILIWNLK